MIYNKSGPVVEAGIMSAVAIIFTIITIYVPIVGSFTGFALPVPFMLAGIRHGVKWSCLASVVAAMLGAVILGPPTAPFVLSFGVIGIVMGYFIRAQKSAGVVVAGGAIACLAAIAAIVSVAAVVMGVDLIQGYFSMLETSLSFAIGFYRSIGIDEAQLGQMQQALTAIIAMVRMVFPAALVVGSVFIAYVAFVIARLILKRTGCVVAALPPFKHWVFPPYILYLFILGFILGYVGKYQHFEMATIIGENLKLFGGAFAFVQGLAVFYFLADKYNLSRLMRGIILLLIFTNLVYQYLVIFGGAFEIALDYRRLRTSRLP
ncbi:MAG: hypothetical protein H6Q73_3848 [Firmicutes bacterium]|nr:hypothetical protein [Bacillota bacterium]